MNIRLTKSNTSINTNVTPAGVSSPLLPDDFRRYAALAASLPFGVLLFSAASVANALPRSHCKLNEEALFTCNMRSKTLSVCSSKEVTGSPRTWIQYRFGVVGNPELIYPPDLRSPVGVFKYSLETGGRWRDVRIQFSSNGFKYVLHAYGNSGIVESEASLTVVTPEGVKKKLQCADPGTYAAAGLWPFEEFKLPPVDEEFSR